MRAVVGVVAGIVLITFGLSAPVNAAEAPVDVAFSELDFEYSRSTNIASNVVPLSARCTTSSSVNCVGKNQGDKVLFSDVVSISGLRVDALVTTKSVGANNRIRFYEVRASYPEWENNPKWFWVNAINDSGGETVVTFTIEFFVNGTYSGSSGTRVSLKNFQMTGVEIDNDQSMTFHDGSAYTLAKETRLTVTVDENAGTMRFQGPSTNSDTSTSPLHQAVVTYGARESVEFDIGRKPSTANSTFAVAFKELSWAGVPTETTEVTEDPNPDPNPGPNPGPNPDPEPGPRPTVEQKPLTPVRLPSTIPPTGTVTIVKKPVVTNAGKTARVRVKCQTLLRGDMRPCLVTRSHGKVTMTTYGYRLNVTVRIYAPSTGDYLAFKKVKRYNVA